MQIFTRNARRWASKPLDPEQAEGFKAGVKEQGLQEVMAHGSYLTNLASPDPRIHKLSVTAFEEELDRSEALGIPYFIIHPGSHRGTSFKEGLNTLTTSLQRSLANRPGYKVMLLLETTAGGGKSLGGSFELLAEILDQVDMPGRVGICLDTAHVFAAGYDIRTQAGYEETLDAFKNQIGFGLLKAFHINDSRSMLNSHHDIHANIGEGQIGLESFRRLVNDRRFKRHPMNLETPGGEEAFKRNLQLLYRLRRR
jgi:deoxyribonuclease-4